MEVKPRKGKSRLFAGENATLNILKENCTVELPSAADMPWAVYFFWPIGGVKGILKCHGDDLIDGHKEVLICEDKIHAILGMGDNRFHADFPIVAEETPAETPEASEAITAA